MTNHQNWIADRCKTFSSSGIRKVFDLAASLKDPINLSIGQPDFDVPDSIKQACIDAIQAGKNAYSPTQGIGPLREKLKAQVLSKYAHPNRDLFIASGTSGGLVVAMMALVNPGDEVIVFDPYFVMYPPLIQMMGGKPVVIDTYPDFQIDVKKVEQAITPKTKLVLFNTPANPTGVLATRENTKALAELCQARGIALISDEIYSGFCFDEALTSPAEFNPDTIVIDGFSKSHAMTGWRLGWVHGPSTIMQEMLKIQQYSFVCAPQPVQWAVLQLWIMTCRDIMRSTSRSVIASQMGYAGTMNSHNLTERFTCLQRPLGTATEFVTEAIANGLLIIPGNIFSQRDTHFRISFAAKDETLDRGIEVLRKLAKQ